MLQARGLQQMFSGRAVSVVSVVSGPSAPDSHPFVLALARELSRDGGRVWLAASSAAIARELGCRPLLPWRAGLPLAPQIISTGQGYGLIHAPQGMAGDTALSGAVNDARSCDFLLFDGGRFSLGEAPIDAAANQVLVILLGCQDGESGYALVKALRQSQSPARVLLVGEAADSIGQTAAQFLGWRVESRQVEAGLCQIGNKSPVTSSNTLSAMTNLRWVLSRISQNYHSRAAHGGGSEGAKKVC